MTKTYAVVGSSWGDEAKGLMVDYLAAKAPDRTLVVRHSSGANCGHTVKTPEGIEHVFGHFGAGTLLKCPTYLGPHYIVNPVLYHKELTQLKTKGFSPKLYIDEWCRLTTPYDVAINQFMEQFRMNSKNNHGSCGVGINETVERSNSGRHGRFMLHYRDIPKGYFPAWLIRIRNEWFPERLKQLGIDPSRPDVIEWRDRADHKFFDYIEMADQLYDDGYETSRCGLSQYGLSRMVLNDPWNQIIYEGSQGLKLDEHNTEDFPHLTRARTGLHNVIELLNQNIDRKTKHIHVYYVSRTYFTRHGSGPLPGEVFRSDLGVPHCPTNISNLYQGYLRYAPLDTEIMWRAICKDLDEARQNFKGKITYSVVLTHCDQIQPKPEWFSVFPISHLCYGRTRNDIKELEHRPGVVA